MGVNYTQYCFVGVKIDSCDSYKLISEAVYQEQPRFDPRTGKETHKAKVLVKHEVCEYSALGCKAEDFYDLYSELHEKYNKEDISVDFFDEDICIGINFINRRCFGNVDLLEGETSIESLLAVKEKVCRILGVEPEEVKLLFVTSVG